MKYALICAAAALAFSAAPSATYAQQSSQQHPAATNVKAKPEFIKSAAEHDMAVIQLAQVAKQKSSSSEVKQLADQLMRDATNNQTQVKDLATKENITLPTTINEKDHALKMHLQGLSGAQFDKEYLNATVQGNKQTIAAFQAAARQSKDSNLQTFAQNTLPVLQQHLKMAEDAQNSVVGTSGK